MVPTLLDDRTVAAAAHHLNHHAKAAAAMCAWRHHLDATGPEALKNACLESTFVHLRLLIEFVAGRRRDQNDPHKRKWTARDIRPAHFVANWTGTANLDSYLRIADEHVMHLSIERARTIVLAGPPLEYIVEQVLVELDRFADSVEAAGRPVAAAIRAGLTEARQLFDHPSDSWPPEI